MTDGVHDLRESMSAIVQHIYDVLPADPECHRLFLKWKRECMVIGKLSVPASKAQRDEVSETYRELLMNLSLEGVEV